MPTPKPPTTSIPLYVMEPATDAKIVDIPGNGQIKLGISARPTDVGVIGYNWKKYKYIPETGQYDVNAIELTSNIKIEPKEIIGQLNPDDWYYTIEGEGDNIVYSRIDVLRELQPDSNDEYHYLYEHDVDDGEGNITTEYVNTAGENDTAVGYLTIHNSFIPHLYQKISTAIVNETGIYTVDISAKALVNTTTAGMKQENGIIVPGPLSPVVTVPSEIKTGEGDTEVAHVIVDDTPYVLAPRAVAGEIGKDASLVGDVTGVDVVTMWQQYNGESWVPVTAIEDKVAIDGNNIVISDLINTETVIGDQYREAATSTRNGVSTTTYSAPYRVTHSPEKPRLNIREYNRSTDRYEWVERDYSMPNLGIKNMGANALLSVGVTAQNLKTDNLSYIWVKAIRTNEEDSHGIYEVDLPNDEEHQRLIDRINNSLGIIDDDEGNVSSRSKDDIIKELSKIAEVELDEGDTVTPRYQTEFQTEESGVYYCVVINELNNNIAVNVSPFFIVPQ